MLETWSIHLASKYGHLQEQPEKALMCLKYTLSLSLTCLYPIFFSASTNNSEVFSCSCFCSSSCPLPTMDHSFPGSFQDIWQCKPLSHLHSVREEIKYKIKAHPVQQPGLSMLSPGPVYLFFVSSLCLLHLSSHISNLRLIQVLRPFIFLILLFPWTVFLWWVAVAASTVLK